MNLEVGNYYLNAIGEIVKIDSSWLNTHFNIRDNYYYDINDTAYFENGKTVGDCREFDLIAEIPKELHWNLMYNIKNFHTNGNVRKKLRRKYNNYINCCVSKNKELK